MKSQWTFYQWLNAYEFMTKREFKELPKYKQDNYRTEYEMFMRGKANITSTRRTQDERN